MTENLQSNSFYLALLDHIPELERSSVKNGYIVCIPQTAALPESHRMSLRLLRMHVLVPTSNGSEYRTLNSSITVKRVNEKDLEAFSGSTLLSSTC
jgi:hypothetical protein